MCGIVGYVGSDNAQKIILGGLSMLEYRGYDSAGICVLNEGVLNFKKVSGKLDELKNVLIKAPLAGTCGIGHTRWATHGAATDVNAHPHFNQDGSIAIVHNGIIENYAELKESLSSRGFKFSSETDSEVIAHLLSDAYKGDILNALFSVAKELKGSYALAVVSAKNTEQIVAVKQDAPLIVGVLENSYMIASDVPAVLAYTKRVIYLENGDFVRIALNNLQIYNKAQQLVEREVTTIDWSVESIDKKGYEHFMLKEIYEQDVAVTNTISNHIANGAILPNLKVPESIKTICLVACGTAYYAGLSASVMLENLTKIPVISILASEIKHRKSIINKNTLVIVISQSGETADTLMAVRYAKSLGSHVWGVVNSFESSIAREVDQVFYTKAGIEIAVASTKAYTTQLVMLYMLTVAMARNLKTIDEAQYSNYLQEIKILPYKVAEALEATKKSNIKAIAEKFIKHHSAFYLGRENDYFAAQEGALKMKEISYIHAEAFAAGELKHGSIALIEDGMPVVAIATQNDVIDKIVSNIKEVKARGAYVLAVTTSKKVQGASDDTIFIPEVATYFSTVLAVIPLQLLAYNAALLLNRDIDKPRNLAKSVTVE